MSADINGMDSIVSNLTLVREAIGRRACLVAVSKFHPAEAVLAAYGAGQRVFGESRANELELKATTLPHDIRWHFIGHLQTNKVRKVVKYASCIQSVDSRRLLLAINDEAIRIGRTVDILLQVHVAAEETKTGFLPDELTELMTAVIPASLPGVSFRGVMGMASNTDCQDRIRRDFTAIRQTFDSLRHSAFAGYSHFDTVSMGMSHDFGTAIECGSTMVRIGTTIFGERQY